jgi:hypothetical protein
MHSDLASKCSFQYLWFIHGVLTFRYILYQIVDRLHAILFPLDKFVLKP